MNAIELTKRLVSAQETLVKEWAPETTEAVFAAISRMDFTPIAGKEFLNHCTACGGDWGAMFLSGVKSLWPEVWEALPDRLGRDGAHAWCNITSVTVLCGVDWGDGE